ncbi:hypothetical protein HNQ70_001057 [Quisquiliibacterium transsilvanicum]|uniref:Uncharacterized protein n=1 Tax=Quisquiliibacterium transsilvanicum TaxID=1549638 RepID=A0A7W8HFN4_9BURK|nr:hypothetical protein [Quisquiliibacterium transsilvanicum]
MPDVPDEVAALGVVQRNGFLGEDLLDQQLQLFPDPLGVQALEAPQVDAVEKGLVDALFQLEVGATRRAMRRAFDDLELALLLLLVRSQTFA